jgi:hypothetical protein
MTAVGKCLSPIAHCATYGTGLLGASLTAGVHRVITLEGSGTAVSIDTSVATLAAIDSTEGGPIFTLFIDTGLPIATDASTTWEDTDV